MDRKSRENAVKARKLGTAAMIQTAQTNFNESIDDNCKQIKDAKVVGVKQIKEANITILTFPYKEIGAVLRYAPHFIPSLEKKYGGIVFVVGCRRAFPVEPVSGRRYRRFRPSKRLLRIVNESYLQDLAHGYPIASKMTNYNHEGKQKTTIVLASRSKDLDDARLRALGLAYRRLTGLDAEFVKQAQ